MKIVFTEQYNYWINQTAFPDILLQTPEKLENHLPDNTDPIINEFLHDIASWQEKLKPYETLIHTLYKENLYAIIINISDINSFEEFKTYYQSHDDDYIRKQILGFILDKDDDFKIVDNELIIDSQLNANIQHLLTTPNEWISLLQQLPFEDTLRWHLIHYLTFPRQLVDDFVALHQKIEPLFAQFYQEYVTEFLATKDHFLAHMDDYFAAIDDLSSTHVKNFLHQQIQQQDQDQHLVIHYFPVTFYYSIYASTNHSEKKYILTIGYRFLEAYQKYYHANRMTTEKAIHILKTLGDPTRYSILTHIAQGEKSIKNLANLTHITSATASHHAQSLQNLGILNTLWKNKSEKEPIDYALIDQVITQLQQDIGMPKNT